MAHGLALVGYGKMGRLIERLAPEHGFEVCARFDVLDNAGASGLSSERLRGAEAAMEFTSPNAAVQNLRRLAELRMPTVCGTTGWYSELPRVREAFAQGEAPLVWAANFSVGMNIFFQIVAEASAWFAKQQEYEAWGWEIHHSAKKDAPSGTLLKLRDAMRDAGFAHTVNLSASRAGAHPGTHEIGFDSAADTITLRHTARTREGFARGALLAARWIAGKRGVHEFREILGELNGVTETRQASTD